MTYRPKPAPLRDVISATFCQCRYSRTGEGSVNHKLECGHSIWAKKGHGYPRRKRCSECLRQQTQYATSEDEA